MLKTADPSILVAPSPEWVHNEPWSTRTSARGAWLTFLSWHERS
jgi:hypothetical protein